MRDFIFYKKNKVIVQCLYSRFVQPSEQREKGVEFKLYRRKNTCIVALQYLITGRIVVGMILLFWFSVEANTALIAYKNIIQ